MIRRPKGEKEQSRDFYLIKENIEHDIKFEASNLLVLVYSTEYKQQAREIRQTLNKTTHTHTEDIQSESIQS